MKALCFVVTLLAFSNALYAAEEPADITEYSCQKETTFVEFRTLLEIQITLSTYATNPSEAILQFRMTNLEYPPPREAWHVMCFSYGPMSVKQTGAVATIDGRAACIDGSINPWKVDFDTQTLELTNTGEAGDKPYKCTKLVSPYRKTSFLTGE